MITISVTKTLSSIVIGKLTRSQNANLSALEDAKAMILTHNGVVQDDDIVVFGGDIQASKQGREWIGKIIPKLKGRKILVRGNHDHFKNEEYIEMDSKAFMIF